MNEQQITVFYKWTAQPGKLQELKEIYDEVCADMQQNEPGTVMMQYYIDEEQNALVVHDLFGDASALGMHLGVTAPSHFGKLLEIAKPGPFFFCGDVPEEMRQAAIGMNIGAEFSQRVSGFVRA